MTSAADMALFSNSTALCSKQTSDLLFRSWGTRSAVSNQQFGCLKGVRAIFSGDRRKRRRDDGSLRVVLIYGWSCLPVCFTAGTTESIFMKFDMCVLSLWPPQLHTF